MKKQPRWRSITPPRSSKWSPRIKFDEKSTERTSRVSQNGRSTEVIAKGSPQAPK